VSTARQDILRSMISDVDIREAVEKLDRYAREVRAEQREVDAQLAETLEDTPSRGRRLLVQRIAALIRYSI
jgi:chemotaxis regulatin CheY-phosphate phosphatase CheZ